MKIKDVPTWIEENLGDLIYKKTSPLLLWKSLETIYYFFFYYLPWRYRRTICHLKGCDIKGGSGGWNLPPEAELLWCERCNATESNYELETSYKLIYKN